MCANFLVIKISLIINQIIIPVNDFTGKVMSTNSNGGVKKCLRRILSSTS